MSKDAYLYFIYDEHGRLGYVGIGGRSRPYEPHTPEVDALRDRSGDVRITSEPFSSRRDAERAESLLVRALYGAEQSGSTLLNIAKRYTSRDLVPVLPFRNGVLRYSELTNSLIVKVSLDRIDDQRVVVSGVTKPADAAERCRKYWPLGRCVAQEFPVKRLVAVSTADAKPVRVIGVWEVKPVGSWTQSEDGKYEVGLADPSQGDLYGCVGQEFEWEGYNPQLVGYSSDIRRAAGLSV